MRDVEVSAATTEHPVEDDRLATVERWAGELIVPPGEDPAVQLADGTLWHTAFEEALAEIGAGRPAPSPEWRRAYALPLGLQRVLSDPKPHLAGGL